MRNFMGYDRRWLDEPHVGDHVGRSIWALGDILATAWIPAVVGRRATCSTGSSARSQATSRCERPRMRCSASHASTRIGSSRPRGTLLERLVEQLGDAHERTASDDWCWFEDSAQLRQRTPVAGAPRRRQRARPDRPRRARARLAALARRRVRPRRRRAPAARAPRTAPGRACAGRRRRAAARRRRPGRGRADRLRDHAQSRARTPCDHGVRMVPRPQSAAASRSTTSRPAAAATGSGASRSTTTKAPNRRSPSIRRRSSWTQRAFAPAPASSCPNPSLA